MHFNTSCLLFVAIIGAQIYTLKSGVSCPAVPDAEVLILGAGMAGISAAKILHDGGQTDFIILEARDRVGGRMKLGKLGNLSIELGANWIHGINPNQPIWVLAQQCGLKGSVLDLRNLTVHKGSQIVPDYAILNAGVKLLQILKKIIPFSNFRKNNGLNDISLYNGLKTKGWDSIHSLIKTFIEWYIIDYDASIPPRNGSLFDTTSMEKVVFGKRFQFPDWFVKDSRGYEYLVHCLASQFNFVTDSKLPDKRLHLNTLVTSIKWSNYCICVDTNSGKTFCGRKAINTFSVGVLQSSVPTYYPPLPLWKMNAINKFIMAMYLKIYAKFNTTFWDKDKSNFIGRLNSHRGWYHVFQLVPDHPNTLLICLTEPVSRIVSQQPIEKTKEQITTALKEMYPSARFEIVDILVPNWAQDPLYQGAFSATPPGTNDDTRNSLAAPVGQLYFSGEATSKIAHSSVEGAYLAGIQTAKAILSDN